MFPVTRLTLVLYLTLILMDVADLNSTKYSTLTDPNYFACVTENITVIL